MSHRLFTLQRTEDVTGMSGTGVVAEGVEYSDGTVVLRWLPAGTTSDGKTRGVQPTTVVHPNIRSVEALHGHDGRTKVVWSSPPLTDAQIEALEHWGFGTRFGSRGRFRITAGGSHIMYRDEDGGDYDLAVSTYTDAESTPGGAFLTATLTALLQVTGQLQPRGGSDILWQIGDTISPAGDDGVGIVREIRDGLNPDGREVLGVSWFDRHDDTPLTDMPITDVVDDGRLICHPGIGEVTR